MRRGILTRLRGDRRGVTILEFALVTPVMLILIMGLGQLLYDAYAKSILVGEIQKAARDSGIEGGAARSSTIDDVIITRMTPIMKNLAQGCGATSATTPVWCSTRKSYDTFGKVNPEPFTDTNANGVRDPGECFDDVNANGTWDADPGLDGQGGASAVTLYTMSITYPPVFPVVRLLGWPSRSTISSTTLLKNQPYATQVTTATTTVCT